jgi:hypothetical protein
MTGRSMGCMLVSALLVCSLCACYRQSVLTVVADPAIGHPCPEEGGLCVRVRCTGGEAPYVLDFGDETEASSGSGIAEHVYRPPFHRNEYRITASCEAGIGSTTVSIENRPPMFYDIFSVKGGQAAEREMVILQVNYFTKGCGDCPDLSCEPCRIFGGLDPDGDVLYYEWDIRKQGGSQEDSVYDLSGNRVNGRAVPGDYFVWFPMWREAKPPWPFSPLPSVGSADEGTGSGLQPVEVQAELSPKGNYYPYTIRLTITDFCGATCTYETTWEILDPFD